MHNVIYFSERQYMETHGRPIVGAKNSHNSSINPEFSKVKLSDVSLQHSWLKGSRNMLIKLKKILLANYLGV
uniref:Uncharacterized protein n=1 Tax=Anguilla anguilla TaxID=7936 RepID=A0A0E9WNK6_ANGAN